MSDFEIHDLSSNHNFRTEVPNIIFEIGLPPQLIGVYAAIKRSAGDQGTFFKSESKLAKELLISKTTLHKFIEILCLVNDHIKKPLLKKKNRISKDGDKDTNLITITDIWPENAIHFSRELGGRVNSVLPRVNSNLGVAQNLPKGRVNSTHKEEPIRKNLFKKTTTPTPSFDVHKVVAVVVSISKEEKEAAKALNKWTFNESHKERKRKIGRYYEDIIWGDLWNIPLEVYEKLIFKHGIKYFQAQLEYMHKEQVDFDKGIKKKSIENPETYLKRSCRENWADSDHDKKEKNEFK